MLSLEQRLDKIEEVIKKPSFRQNKGLGNEVGYYIFDYPAEQELVVRERIEYIRQKNEEAIDGFRIVVFDLYDIIISIRRFLTVFTATFPGGKSRSSVRTASPTTMASLPIISQNFCGSFVKNHSVMRWTSISNSAATSTSAIRSPCAR